MNKNKKKLIIPAAVLLAILAFVGAYRLSPVRSQQYPYYNAGLQALQNGDVDKSIQLFDKSLSVYDSEAKSGWMDHLIYGRPSTEVAAMAHFYKGLALLEKAQAEKRPGIMGEAVDEFETSLKLNPGVPYKNVSAADAERLNSEALVVKHDLDLLFQKHPEQQQNGKGQGQGQPQQGPAQQAPNQNPGNKPGHGDDSQI